MAKKPQARLRPQLDEEMLAETFAAQLETGVVCDARVEAGALPALDGGRGDPVRLYRCLIKGCNLGSEEDRMARGLRAQDCVVDSSDFANVDWTGSAWERVEFVSTRLTGALWTEARLKHVLFRQCKLDLALFRMAGLAHCEFAECNLVEADFYGANLSHAIFRGCDLSRVDFSAADLTGADLRDCRLDGLRGMPARMEGLRISADQAAILIGLFGIKVVW